jgi:hypothetical protein
MTIRKFFRSFVQTITSFGHNKAKMNQPVAPAHHATISIPPPPVATTASAPAHVAPHRVAKHVKPAKTVRIERRVVTPSSPDLYATFIRGNNSKIRARYMSHAGNLRTAYIISLDVNEAIIRRHKKGPGFMRIITA